jgi:hypothetical protein
MGCRAKGDRERSRIAFHAFREFQAPFERETLLRRRTGDFVHRQEADEPATIFGVWSPGNIFVSQDPSDIQPLAHSHLERDVGGQDVAGMVEHDKENARAAVRQAQSFQAARRTGGGKNLSGNADIEHAFADETAEARLMSATSESDNSNLSCRFGIGSSDEIAANELDLSGMSKSQPFEQLPNNVFGAIDELLHSHGRRDEALPPVIRPAYR